MSQVIKEVVGVLDITLNHAITKHALKIGKLEQSRASIRQALKIKTGEGRSLWHKWVSIAVLITTLLISQALAVSQAECFMVAFFTMS